MNSSTAIDPGSVPDEALGREPFGRRAAVSAVRTFAAAVVGVMIIFLISNYLNVAHQWPGLPALFAHYGWFGLEALRQPLSPAQVTQGWLQLFSYLGAGVFCAVYVALTARRSLQDDSRLLSGLAAYIIRASFWAVLLIGLADITISFLRVEELLAPLVGEELTQSLGRAHFRGLYVHYPLLLLSFIIALFSRTLGFIWLTLLVVLAEFVIVISRFVFSYEQPFMGDLVRFWYAALFLFASAYTLVSDGHVRVDVLYSRFRKPAKAWVNIVGTLLLGLPLAWIILVTGMWDKTSSINSPLYSFEVSQSGYGLYVKYLMVGFLAVYAVSMIVQFASYLLYHVAGLQEEPGDQTAQES